MKKLLVLVLALCSITVLAQDKDAIDVQKEPELTNAEMFYRTAGRLTHMHEIKIGKVKNVDINVKHYRDMMTDEAISVLRFEALYANSYTSDQKIGALDSDEIDGLIKSLRIMQEMVYKESPQNYTEITFTSRTGFEAGCYYSVEKKHWRVFLKLEKYDSRSSFYLDREDLLTILSFVTKAAYEIETYQNK